MGEHVVHHCLVDNSAALHLCHRRGPGKLWHISGKLLWIQELVAQEEIRVKVVGTVYNVADPGTNFKIKGTTDLPLVPCLKSGVHGRIGEWIGA